LGAKQGIKRVIDEPTHKIALLGTESLIVFCLKQRYCIALKTPNPDRFY
jgi:hypothetical protein